MSSTTSSLPVIDERALYEFRYGEDIFSPNIQHQTMDIFKNYLFRERLIPILEKLAENHKLYKDPDYPTQPLLLKSEKIVKECKWVRPTKFIGYEGKYRVIADTHADSILVADEVVQYFGIFLIMLAKNPELIDATIELTENSFGLNVIRMFRYGEEKHVLIDDEILCDDKSAPVFSQQDHNQAWPLLL